jgi:hypothetical protein
MFNKKLFVFFLLIITGNFLSNSAFKSSCDSAYCNAMVYIINSCCIKNDFISSSEDIYVWFADEILELNRPYEIDTNSKSFYKNSIMYPRSRIIDSMRTLKKYNSVSDDVFTDTSKLKIVVFFSEIKNNYFIAEVYLYNYFPIIEIGKKYGLNKDIVYRRSYEYLKDFEKVSRFLFVVSGNEIVNYKCY